MQSDKLFITENPQSQTEQRKNQNKIKKKQENDVIPLQQIGELTKKCLQLIDECKQIRIRQCLTGYRQMGSQVRQIKIRHQSELMKLESIAKIDITYIGKCLRNEGQPNYGQVLRRVTREQQQWQSLWQNLQQANKKLKKLSNDIGM